MNRSTQKNGVHFSITCTPLQNMQLAREVSFAIENVPRGYTREPTRLVELMTDLGAPNVGVVIDTGHRNIGGDPVEALAGHR